MQEAFEAVESNSGDSSPPPLGRQAAIGLTQLSEGHAICHARGDCPERCFVQPDVGAEENGARIARMIRDS